MFPYPSAFVGKGHTIREKKFKMMFGWHEMKTAAKYINYAHTFSFFLMNTIIYIQEFT